MKLAKAITVIAGSAALLIGGIWVLHDRLVYFPGRDPGPPPSHWNELVVTTDDGLRLIAWKRAAAQPTRAATVIVFPGNAGNREGRVPLGDGLAASGFNVVLAEYRGYGGNPGRPSEDGLERDAAAVIRAVREQGIGDGSVVFFGESLGAAVAVAAAVGNPPDGLILGSPFTSLADVAAHHYGWIPVRLVVGDAYPSLSRIEHGDLDETPSLVIVGSQDRTVPAAQSRAVAAALGAAVYEVAGADHNDPSIRSAPAMIAAVSAFLDEALSGPNPEDV
jgi:hypothetical protein